MKKSSYFHILIYLFTLALALEVIVLARQNYLLKKKIQTMQSQQAPEVLKAGETIAAIPGTDFNDTKIQIDFSSPKTLVFLFGTQCPHCLKMIPIWRGIFQEFGNDKIKIFAITKNPPPVVNEYARGYQIQYPIVFIEEENYSKIFKSNLIPQTLVVGQGGKIEKNFLGALNPKEIEELKTFLK